MFKLRNLFTKSLILSIILISLNVNTFVQAQSISSNDNVSFDEYYSAMKAEYAVYGITYEVYQKNDNFICTQTILNEQLKKAREQGESYKVQVEQEKKQTDLIKKAIKKQTNGNDSRIMYVNKTYSKRETIQSPSKMGSAQICLEGTAQADADKGLFIRAISSNSYQSGAYVNFKSWEQKSSNSFLYSFSGSNVPLLFAEATGILTVEYIESITGLLVGYSSEHTLNCAWTY